MTFALSEKKSKHVSPQCQIFKQPKTSSLKSQKANWPVAIDCPGHFTSSNPVSISSTGANISSTEKRVLQWSCDAGEFSLGGTCLVYGKLETLQREGA